VHGSVGTLGDCRSAVRGGNGGNDREAEPTPLFVPRFAVLGTPESFEGSLALRGIEPRPIVDHLDARAACNRRDPHLDRRT
jgi:hypothetical protein